MKKFFSFLILFTITIAFWQCSPKPNTADDVELVVQSIDGTALAGASVQINDGTPNLTDSSGDAGDFTLSTGDSVTFTATGFKPIVVYIEDPILLIGLTAQLESIAPEIGAITGQVKFDGAPCGINMIVNLDNKKEQTTCNPNGEYSLQFSNPGPYRIGYISNNGEVLKLKIKTSTDTAKMDVAMSDSGIFTKKK